MQRVDRSARSRRAAHLLAVGIVAAAIAAVLAPTAAQAELTEATATAAFGSWLQQQYPGLQGYWTCPAGQMFDGEAVCTAEFHSDRTWHRVTATAEVSADGITISSPADARWERRWGRYSTRVLTGFPTPGTAAVTGAPYDWSFIAAGAYDSWRRGKTTFVVAGLDGNGSGLDRFYSFQCRARGNTIRCTNSLGDAISYKPRGGPHVSFEGYGRAHWGDRLHDVERTLGVTFDCSQGAVPGMCLCPSSNPPLVGVTLVFSANRLTALFTGPGSGATTGSGIGAGSSSANVRHGYPGARLIRNGPLTSGLSTYYLATRHRHGLTFSMTRGRVSWIAAFADARARGSELCA